MASRIPAAAGWAVVQDGRIMMATVSPTRIAAIVNGLVIVFGVRPLNDWSDDRVEAAWTYECSLKTKDWSGEIKRVAVQVADDGPGSA